MDDTGTIDTSQLPQSAPPTPSGGPTQDVLNLISQARKANKGVRIDFSNLHPSVDKRQVVSAMMDGLPTEDQNKVNAGAMGGRGVAVNYANYPPRQGSDLMQGSIYQDYPKTRFVMRNIVRPGAEMLGQALGGAAGAALGTPEAPGVGTALLGGAGAVAGGTLADELMNKADTMAGLAHPETQLPGNAGSRIGKEALTNAAMVGGGKVVGKVASELAAPFAKSVNPEVQTAARDLKIPLTASQQSDSKILAQSEQMAAKLPGSSGILGDFYAKTRARMMQVVNSLFGKQMNPQIAAQVGDGINSKLLQKTNELAQSGITPQLDPADVGNSVAADISDFTNKKSDQLSEAFESLKKSAPTHSIIPENAMDQAEKVAENVRGIPPAMRNPQLGSVLKKLGSITEEPTAATSTGEYAAAQANLIAKAQNNPALLAQLQEAGAIPKPPSFTIPELMEMRSAVGSAASQHEGAFSTQQPQTKFMGDKVGGGLKSLISAIDDDIEAGTEGTGFSDEYGALREQWHAMRNTMANPYIRRVLSLREPEKIVDALVTKGGRSNLSQIQKMVSPETFEQLGNAFKNKLIENSQNADGQFIPMKLAQQIKQYGEPTLNQIVGPDGLTNLKKLATISDGSFGDPEFRNFIADLGKKNGENVSGMLLGASPANINRIRSLIGEPAFSEAQDGMIHNLLTNNQDNIDFGGLAKRMSQIPPDSLATAIPREKLQILNQLATVGGGIKASQREFMNPSGTAPMIGSFWILRSLFSNPFNAIKVLSSLATGTGLYTFKAGTKYFTQGAINPAAAQMAGSGSAKLGISIAGNRLSNPYKKRSQ